MTEAATESAESSFRWKKKAKFPQNQCAISGCKAKPDGYMPSTRKGKMWYGPICKSCSVKACGHAPTLFQDLRLQRTSDEDLAKVLDVSLEELKELEQKWETLTPTPAEVDEPSEIVEDAKTGTALEVAVIPSDDITSWTKQAEDVLVLLKTFQIYDQQGIDIADGLLRDVKELWVHIETRRKAVGKPFRDQAKKVQAKFKPPLDKLAQAETLLKGLIQTSLARIQQQQMVALQQAQSAFRAGDLQGTAVATQQAVASGAQLPAGLYERSSVQWELVDIRQVPKEYLMLQVNPTAVQNAIANGVTEIPGLRIFEVTTLAQRRQG